MVKIQVSKLKKKQSKAVKSLFFRLIQCSRQPFHFQKSDDISIKPRSEICFPSGIQLRFYAISTNHCNIELTFS
jgi:hypothetical protein